MDRTPALTAFLTASAKDLRAATSGDAARAAGKVISRWDRSAGQVAAVQDGDGERLPVCDWLDQAQTAAAGGPRADLAAAFAAIAGRLTWRRRAAADPGDATFWNGHANAMILGPGGLEQRDDLWVGVTVMAPGVRYMDHHHPPEEVYLSLTPGEWWNAEMDWTDPGPTGAIYNPPGIAHAMRSGRAPFLAFWYLPL